KENETMSLRLGDTVPDFTAESTEGTIHFHDWIGDSWVMLFSHPADFTPVCTTEFGGFAANKAEFEKRGVKIIGVSVDSVEDHKGWSEDIKETSGSAVNFPILGDEKRQIAEKFDMIHPNADTTGTVRTVFIIDPNKKLRLT